MSIIFLLAITLPGLVIIMKDFVNEQKKIKTDFSNPKKIKSSIKSYYSKDFMFHSPFVDYYLEFKMDILKENPIPYNIINGENGWYFLGNNYLNTLNDAFGNDSFSNNELITIENNLSSINRYLKSKSIAFYIVIAPNKNNIYKEHLPYELTQRDTKLKQVQSHLNGSEISFINLSQLLRSAKTKQQLYYKTDSHWNTFGAFLGYQEVMKQIQKNLLIEPEKLSSYNIDYNYEKFGDLTRLLKINTPEKSIFLMKPNVDLSEDYTRPYLRYKNPDKDFKLLMLRDSFANDLIPFFNDTFGEALYLKDYQITEDLIEQETPDIVIYEIAERNLGLIINQKKTI